MAAGPPSLQSKSVPMSEVGDGVSFEPLPLMAIPMPGPLGDPELGPSRKLPTRLPFAIAASSTQQRAADCEKSRRTATGTRGLNGSKSQGAARSSTPGDICLDPRLDGVSPSTHRDVISETAAAGLAGNNGCEGRGEGLSLGCTRDLQKGKETLVTVPVWIEFKGGKTNLGDKRQQYGGWLVGVLPGGANVLQFVVSVPGWTQPSPVFLSDVISQTTLPPPHVPEVVGAATA
jgi:hypothetical protein